MESNSKTKKLRLLNEWLLVNDFAKEAGELNNLIPKPSYSPSITKLSSYNRKSIEIFGEEKSKELQETFKRWWSLRVTNNDALREEIQALSPREAERTYLRFFIINEYNNPDLKDLLNMRTLDKTVIIDKVEFVHNLLDIIGLVPGIGEPADFLNGILYIRENPPAWFLAGLSIFAAIPIIGIGGVVIKRLLKSGKTDEAIELIETAVNKADISKPELSAMARRQIELLIHVKNKLDKLGGAELKEQLAHLPKNDIIRKRITEQVDAIINSIEFASEELASPWLKSPGGQKSYIQRGLSDAVLNEVDQITKHWSTLSPEYIRAYKDLARSATKRAAHRLSRLIKEMGEKRIKEMDPNLTPKQISAISDDIYNTIITKTRIKIIDDPRLVTRFMGSGGGPRTTMGQYQPQGAIAGEFSPMFVINLPSVAMNKLDAQKLSDELVGIAEHEGFHFLDNVIGQSYVKIMKKEMTLGGSPYYSDVAKEGLAKLIRESGNVLAGGRKDYWGDPIEIATRFFSFKNSINNKAFLDNLMKLYPDSTTGKIIMNNPLDERIPAALIYDLQRDIIPHNAVETNIWGLAKKIIGDFGPMAVKGFDTPGRVITRGPGKGLAMPSYLQMWNNYIKPIYDAS